MKKNLRFIFSFLLMLVCSIVGRAATGDVYKLVTNVSDLKSGDVVVIVSVNQAMKSINTSNQSIDAVGVTIINGVLSWLEGLGEVTLEKTTAGWYLKMNGQYINTRNSGKAYLVYNKRMAFSTARDSGNGLYSITVSSSGSATIENLGRDRNEYISYAGGTDGFMFGDGSKIQILKKHELVDYTFDESEANTIEAWDNANVTLNRTLVANKWNTLCLPFDVEGDNLAKLLGEGAQVTEYSTTDSEGTLKFAKADKIEAGHPYLVKPTKVNEANVYTFEGIEIKATEPTVAGDDVKFKGLFSPKDITEDGKAAGVTANASVVFAKPGSTTKAFRAYFVVPATSSASALRLSIDNTPTAISDIYVDGEAADAPVYNLQGQRVDGRSLTKGVYIKNGRKFVVK